MQVNRTGYLLFAVFGGGGLIFIALGLLLPLDAAGLTFLGIGGIWVLVTLGLIGYAIHGSFKARHDQWLYKNGVKGKGTLLAATQGVIVNEQPHMTLTLDLDVPGQEPRQVDRSMIVSRFAAQRFHKGLVLPVYVNPQDPDDILVVW